MNASVASRSASSRHSRKAGLDVGPVSNEVAFSTAEHWRRYAHRCSIIFKDKAGGWHCLAYCKAAIKRAMLAVGTQGRMYVIGEGPHKSVVRWRGACLRLRNADYLMTLL